MYGDSHYYDRSSYRSAAGGVSYGDGRGDGGPRSSFGGDASFGSGLKPITSWDLSRLPVFEKNFYIEHPDVKARSERRAEEWRRQHSISVIGHGIPKVS